MTLDDCIHCGEEIYLLTIPWNERTVWMHKESNTTVCPDKKHRAEPDLIGHS